MGRAWSTSGPRDRMTSSPGRACSPLPRLGCGTRNPSSTCPSSVPTVTSSTAGRIWSLAGGASARASFSPPRSCPGSARLLITWVTEEADSIWSDRADAFEELYEPVPWEGLTLVDALSAPPAALLNCVASREADVVIVDTVRECCGILSMRDDDAVRGAVSPWLRRLRDGRRTLIFVAQHRKAAGERGERVEGSVALPSMFDVVIELEAVEGHERRRRLTSRRRRSQVAPLVYEMDTEDRLVVIPDARSRSRVESEAAALAVVNASAEPISTAEVRRQMTPRPSPDTALRILGELAKNGRIRRDPPITEPAERRRVVWVPAAPDTLPLPQNFTSHTWEFAAAESSAADFASDAPSDASSTVAPPTAADPLADAVDRCSECGLVGWLKRAPGGFRCGACGALSQPEAAP